MLNRSLPPKIKPITEVKLPEYTIRNYPNGMQMIIVNSGVHEVFKIETIFQAGRFYEHKKLASGATLRMLREGSKKYSSEEIAEKIDFYGANLYNPTNLDYSGLTLYGLNNHFKSLLPIYKSIITEPVFPEKELSDYILEKKQTLQVDLSKNDTIAYRTVTENIYGTHHPYGYNSTPEMMDDLSADDLHKHYNDHYRSANATIVLSGKISNDMIAQIEQDLFPHISSGHSLPQEHKVVGHQDLHQFIHKDESIQTAIRVGQLLLDRNHEDYYGLYFLNIILGDYFSSRLMMNIREDKGYTYNIYSMLDMMKHSGMILIGTETANEYVQPTVKEIKIEFDRLRNEIIPQEELEMARNYTLGTFLSALDGPFNTSDIIKGLYLEDLNETHFNQLIHSIKTINGEDLRNLARKYLHFDHMYTVMVGKMI